MKKQIKTDTRRITSVRTVRVDLCDVHQSQLDYYAAAFAMTPLATATDHGFAKQVEIRHHHHRWKKHGIC
jgi:hypothetical protein